MYGTGRRLDPPIVEGQSNGGWWIRGAAVYGMRETLQVKQIVPQFGVGYSRLLTVIRWHPSLEFISPGFAWIAIVLLQLWRESSLLSLGYGAGKWTTRDSLRLCGIQ